MFNKPRVLALKAAGRRIYDYLLQSIRNLYLPKYLTFKEALNKFATETSCYLEVFEHPDMRVTQERCYFELLCINISEGKVPLYGVSKFSSRNKLTKIPRHRWRHQRSWNRYSVESDVIYSVLGEALYTNLSFRRRDVEKLIKEYQDMQLAEF